MTEVTLQRKNQGSLLWRFSKKFQFAADKIIPDSLVFCLILTIYHSRPLDSGCCTTIKRKCDLCD